MIKKNVKVKNREGLHGRPVNFLNICAGCFASSIFIEKNERRANAKSLMGVLSLSVMGGEEVLLIADGVDEQEAAQKIEQLICSGFSDEDLIDEIRSR